MINQTRRSEFGDFLHGWRCVCVCQFIRVDTTTWWGSHRIAKWKKQIVVWCREIERERAVLFIKGFFGELYHFTNKQPGDEGPWSYMSKELDGRCGLRWSKGCGHSPPGSLGSRWCWSLVPYHQMNHTSFLLFDTKQIRAEIVNMGVTSHQQSSSGWRGQALTSRTNSPILKHKESQDEDGESDRTDQHWQGEDPRAWLDTPIGRCQTPMNLNGETNKRGGYYFGRLVRRERCVQSWLIPWLSRVSLVVAMTSA